MRKFLLAACIIAALAILGQVLPQPSGTFLGVPYDLRPPTWRRLRNRQWNPSDRRILTPMAFGVGWTVNLFQVARRLGLIG